MSRGLHHQRLIIPWVLLGSLLLVGFPETAGAQKGSPKAKPGRAMLSWVPFLNEEAMSERENAQIGALGEVSSEDPTLNIPRAHRFAVSPEGGMDEYLDQVEKMLSGLQNQKNPEIFLSFASHGLPGNFCRPSGPNIPYEDLISAIQARAQSILGGAETVSIHVMLNACYSGSAKEALESRTSADSKIQWRLMSSSTEEEVSYGIGAMKEYLVRGSDEVWGGAASFEAMQRALGLARQIKCESCSEMDLAYEILELQPDTAREEMTVWQSGDEYRLKRKDLKRLIKSTDDTDLKLASMSRLEKAFGDDADSLKGMVDQETFELFQALKNPTQHQPTLARFLSNLLHRKAKP